MLRILLPIMLLVLPFSAWGEDTVSMYAGYWECGIRGHKETGQVVIDSGRNLFQVKLPTTREIFSFPYSVAKKGSDAVALRLEAPEGKPHFVDLQMLGDDRMTVEFLRESKVPILSCNRVNATVSPVGH